MTNDVDEYAAQVHRRDVRRLIRFAMIVVVVVVVVAIALDNRDDVRVGYVVGDASAPLWLVIVVAVAVGMVFGWLLRFRRRD
jgi:uncharacterized integral membrane protein